MVQEIDYSAIKHIYRCYERVKTKIHHNPPVIAIALMGDFAYSWIVGPIPDCKLDCYDRGIHISYTKSVCSNRTGPIHDRKMDRYDRGIHI